MKKKQEHDYCRDEQKEFVAYLVGLHEAKALGDLAVLRRGIGRFPTLDEQMHPIVLSKLPHYLRSLESWEVRCYYLTATLFAHHRQQTEKGNFGAHLRESESNKKPSERSAGLERRFKVLLASESAELHIHLHALLPFLSDTPIHWCKLLHDIIQWQDEEKRLRVKNRWAKSFWHNAS